MSGRSSLGEFEQLVLLVVVRLGPKAFGPDIADELENVVGRSVTRGALYSTFNRLEQKGLLEWHTEPIPKNHSGHVRRSFRVTAVGLNTLRERRETLLKLWNGIEKALGGDLSS